MTMRMVRSAFVGAASLLCADGLRKATRAAVDTSSCVKLKNMESYSTVELSVGTPPQTFDVVADTGSDNLIVTSCLCVAKGHCAKDDKCFTGTNKSSTYAVQKRPPMVTIPFGSGPVTTVVATDEVKIGNTSAKMEDALLLMVNKKLDPDMEIEGILGLGVHANAKAWKKHILAGAPPGTDVFSAPGFLEASKVPRFSICFNRDGADGVLQLGKKPPQGVAPLGNVGSAHWGVGLSGVVVGGKHVEEPASAKFAVCDPASAKGDQKAPCGAIVDSGTTYITAPPDHLEQLYEAMCEAWAPCKSALAAQGEKRNVTTALGLEVAKCTTDDMPTLQFFVEGSHGGKQTLELEPADYVMQTEEEVRGRKETSCILSFGPLDYETDLQGGVWILGTAFFHKYTVHYELTASSPSITFGPHECAPCGTSSLPSLAASQSTALRRLTRPPRYPHIDTTLPF